MCCQNDVLLLDDIYRINSNMTTISETPANDKQNMHTFLNLSCNRFAKFLNAWKGYFGLLR